MPASHKNANDLYTALNSSVTPKSIKGEITVDLASVKCTISGKDAIGHLIQEWFFEWCKRNTFKVIPNSHTQQFPDYYLDFEGNEKGMLEIKNFNYEASPAFDVADFYAFVETITSDIHKLYADYIVFGYSLSSNGELKIPKVWKLKIWEITGVSADNHVTCQIRGKKCQKEKDKKLADDNIDMKGRIQKFRPYNFKDSGNKNKFKSPLEFLNAVQLLLSHNNHTKADYADWLDKVKKSHIEKYGNPLA